MPRRLGTTGTVICGIPLVLLALAKQGRFIDAMLAVAPGQGAKAGLPALQLLRDLAVAGAQARAGGGAGGMDAAEPAVRERVALHPGLSRRYIARQLIPPSTGRHTPVM